MKLPLALLLVGLPLGLAALGSWMPNADAQTETILHSFAGSPNNDGFNPEGGLLQGSDGNLYGTTAWGGTNGSCHEGCGTVFRISPSGSYTSLYSFSNSPDGAIPWAGLVQGGDGNFYGTTAGGGTSSNYNSVSQIYGGGTVFRISPSGSYTSLYSFGISSSDGFYPQAGLLQGSDGNLYGTTEYGGTSTNCSGGCGTVFRITPGGTYTTVYSFAGSPDGANPTAALIQGSDGNLYGTTAGGGTSSNYNILSHLYGGGTVFRISPSGGEMILYSFGPAAYGLYPEAGLVEGSDGNFYGTLYAGRIPVGGGTVFQISPSGSLTITYSFAIPDDEDANTYAGLVQGSDGNLYGTTTDGGTKGAGIAFRINPIPIVQDLTNFYPYATLYSFGSFANDGFDPQTGLVLGSDGNFYGTTAQGGTSNDGTVFKLTVPLSPPANQISEIQFFNILDSTIVALPIPSVAGETYQLQYTDSMSPTNWLNTGGTITSIGGPLVLIDIAQPLPPQRFYRSVITP
jgi:uncharacterized repeat protein (TIGR03803 family)